MPYQFLDEVAIADVEFRAWGPDLGEVFSSAADATMNVMIEDLNSIKPKQHCSITLENETADMLLFDFLQELIYYKDSEQLLLRAPKVAIREEQGTYYLQTDAVGEKLNPHRHEQGVDVKAVTLHRFSLEQDENGWTANIILDI
ncbi:archease [Nitrosococcus wardiae]|uniref:Archease n=1 Tax=Nitrosococcus wardiae TaxID=1814290 RepID=A0A4P7C136_9GAMM|nr:archease [Nitrosococcus wardiae]QBQ55280.1 archease [Nitrosococcus wardiae]